MTKAGLGYLSFEYNLFSYQAISLADVVALSDAAAAQIVAAGALP
jgi:hypothetical protein